MNSDVSRLRKRVGILRLQTHGGGVEYDDVRNEAIRLLVAPAGSGRWEFIIRATVNFTAWGVKVLEWRAL